MSPRPRTRIEFTDEQIDAIDDALTFYTLGCSSVEDETRYQRDARRSAIRKIEAARTRLGA